jgi:hypothetical protein
LKGYAIDAGGDAACDGVTPGEPEDEPVAADVPVAAGVPLLLPVAGIDADTVGVTVASADNEMVAAAEGVTTADTELEAVPVAAPVLEGVTAPLGLVVGCDVAVTGGEAPSDWLGDGVTAALAVPDRVPLVV